MNMTKPYPSLRNPKVSSKFAPFMLHAQQRLPIQVSILGHSFVGTLQAFKLHEISENKCTLLAMRFELSASQQVAMQFMKDAEARQGALIEMQCLAPINQETVVMGVDEFLYAEETKIPVEVQLVVGW